MAGEEGKEKVPARGRKYRTDGWRGKQGFEGGNT